MCSITARVYSTVTAKLEDPQNVTSFAVTVKHTLPVIMHILRVDSDDKGTGYAAGSLVVVRGSSDASRQGL